MHWFTLSLKRSYHVGVWVKKKLPKQKKVLNLLNYVLTLPIIILDAQHKCSVWTFRVCWTDPTPIFFFINSVNGTKGQRGPAFFSTSRKKRRLTSGLVKLVIKNKITDEKAHSRCVILITSLKIGRQIVRAKKDF